MLQWMGGSRRKVTASRKSTQKRQKQYFEQRKRQQQQHEAASIENPIDGLATCNQQKGSRSLDILSLLNVPKVAEERRAQVTNAGLDFRSSSSARPGTEGNSTMGNHATYAKSFIAIDSTDHYNSTRVPTIMNIKPTPTDCTKATGTRNPSINPLETMSSESVQRNTSKEGNNKSDWKNGSSVELSILDLIRDEEASGSSEGNLAHEAHASFSIEGLGKVGSETPVQSPQQPGRIPPAAPPPFSRISKKLHSRKHFSSILDDLEMEVDTNKQSSSDQLDSFPISGDILDSFGCTDEKLSAVKDGMQLDEEQWEMNSFCNDDSHINLRKGNSSFLDSNAVHEKCGQNQKNENASNSPYFWRNESLDFKFEGCGLPVRRQKEVTDGFDFLDGGRKFPSPGEPKYPPFTCNNHGQADYSSPFYMTYEDTRDNLTWLSEESCSSSAVRGEDLANTPSARYRRRYAEDLQRPLKSSVDEVYDEGIKNRTPSTMRRGEECGRSKKYARTNLPPPKSDYHFPGFTSHEKLVDDEDPWLLKEEFQLPNISPCPRSPFHSSERSQNVGEDVFGTFTQTDLRSKANCSFGRSEKDSHNGFSSENFDFRQPFRSKKLLNASFFSKSGCGESWMGVHQDFEVRVQASNSSEVADFFGEAESATTNPDLSAQGSVTEEGGDKPKTQPPDPENIFQIPSKDKNLNQKSRLPAGATSLKDYGGSPNVPRNCMPPETWAYSSEEDAGESSSPGKRSHESVRKMTNEDLQDTFPAQRQQKLKVSVDNDVCITGNDVGDDNLRGPEAKPASFESPCQLLMFQRCVQFLCVLKG